MGLYLNPGSELFAEALRSEIYVDKTGLIACTNKVLGTMQKYICVSRPRRFGKSLAAQMLAAYYGYGIDCEELFQGLEIAQHPSFEEHKNRYHALFLNIQDFLSRAGSAKDTVSCIQEMVVKELRELFPGLIGESENYLPIVLEKVYRETNRGFVIIIDEWDCIFRVSKGDKESQTIYLDFLESKRWYDGYQFRKIAHVYSPKSVVDAMMREEFDSYWSQTETYEALKIYINMNFDGLKDAIIGMLGGIRCKVNPRTFQNDMTTFQGKDDVLTLLVHLGYLGYDMERKEVFIPNQEVEYEFASAIQGAGWEEVIKAIESSEDKSAQGAISQIRNREYVKSLNSYAGRLLLVGINYDKESKKHQCVIEEREQFPNDKG